MTAALRPAVLGAALATALVLTACGGADGGDAGTGGTGGGGTGAGVADGAGASTDAPGDLEAPGAADGALSVVAAFYPLEFLASRVGGDRVEVAGLTPPGAEPHDLELSPQSLASMGEADLLVLLSGFQPALDDAATGTGTPTLDLAPVADRPYGEDATAHTHAEDEHAAGEHGGDEHGGDDPHFWTDPTHMAEAAEAVAGALSEADPDGAAQYEANTDALVAELTALDEEAEQALAACEVDTLVTAHDSFGYFADRYGFEVRSINGLTPDQEPDARALAEISDFVADGDVRTVYTETLVSTAFADTVAAEAGVRTAVLDPLEGLTDTSAGADYLEVMRSNVDTVRAGQACA